jgi:hypothetical protein
MPIISATMRFQAKFMVPWLVLARSEVRPQRYDYLQQHYVAR